MAKRTGTEPDRIRAADRRQTPPAAGYAAPTPTECIRIRAMARTGANATTIRADFGGRYELEAIRKIIA